MNWLAIETVFVDMDGTLLDLAFDNYFWLQLVPAHYAEQHSIEPAQAKRILAARYREVQGTLNWYCIDYWAANLGLDIKALKAEVTHRISYLPRAIEFLKAVRRRGKRLVLVTNCHQDVLAMKFAATNLDSHLDRAISSHTLRHPKESQEFWLRLQDEEPFDVDRTLLVEDSLPVLGAAREFGIAHLVAIRCPDSRAPPRTVVDYPAVDSIAELA